MSIVSGDKHNIVRNLTEAEWEFSYDLKDIGKDQINFRIVLIPYEDLNHLQFTFGWSYSDFFKNPWLRSLVIVDAIGHLMAFANDQREAHYWYLKSLEEKQNGKTWEEVR